MSLNFGVCALHACVSLMDYTYTHVHTHTRTRTHIHTQGVETHLMMETSGHGALKENYFLDDGAYLAVKVCVVCECVVLCVCVVSVRVSHR